MHDYASLCGETYALGENTLYRLAFGQPLGRWEEVPLPPTLLNRVSATLDARLVEAPGVLYLTLPSGLTVQVTAPGCTP